MRAFVCVSRCSGDDRTGDGDGDDETIGVRLAKLPAAVHYVIFCVNVYNAPSFSAVNSCTARMYHGSAKPKFKGAPLMEFKLEKGSEFESARGVFMAALVRQGAHWSVRALGLPTRCAVVAVLSYCTIGHAQPQAPLHYFPTL